ncbi:hypothetical protein F5878DRAFT_576789 [Lentinula raphanica]|uniref:BRCT domain-containing protein n=1 Tax=Lentinula raphanica TaxID=153919 RepID=A0AA38PGI6_9AGAR|nr:hypothetical protein F5878DRAFT_576789 [Lentinula raphanica]
MTETHTGTRTASKGKKRSGPEVAVKGQPRKKRKGNTVQASARRRSTRPTRNRQSLAENDSDEDNVVEEVVHVKQEDTATEPDDESYTTPAPSAQSKRKRSVVPSYPRKSLKKEPGQTPANSKSRSRSIASVSTLKTKSLPLLRVLALYTDGYWYPGTVGDFQKPDNYKIVFDDASAEWARTGSMRRLDVRVGDEVTNSRTKKLGTVKEVKEDMVVVSSQSGPDFDLPYRDLCISCDKVESQWEDRELTRTLLAGITDISRQSVIPESADNFLRGCGIIITSTPNAQGWNKEKTEIFASMIENGATLIEDWSDALHISGDTGKRKPKSWKITKEQTRWFEDPDMGTIQRVFVLADAVCQKPKYLIALALGVPCLETYWMTDDLQGRNTRDWRHYLLPKGYDTPTSNVMLSQFLNLDWGSTPEHLTNIMDNPYAHKLFAGMNVLCVGDDYIPEEHEERMGANNYGDLKLEALRIVANRSKITSGVALIILAMGASQVTAVADFQDAHEDEHFDFVVFKDMKWNTKYPTPKEGTRHASWAWAKQCLIRGQMLPLY